MILCSLEHALREHAELVAPWYSKRLTIDRHKLEAANAAFWSGGAFLYVPPGVVVPRTPSRSSTRSSRPASPSTGARWCSAARRASSACTSTTWPRTSRARRCTRARLSCTCRTARAAAWRSFRTGARARCSTCSTRFVEVGRDAYCHWLPALLGGHLIRQHLELAVSEPGGEMAFRGLFFTEEHEHLDMFAVDLHETGPSGGDVHWRGAATGESRASFEGLIQIAPRRPADPHLPADPLDDALAARARRRDPLGAGVRRRRVGVARRHRRRARRVGDLLHAKPRP